MGNKLSCNGGPENNGKKNYKYEDAPWAASSSGSQARSISKRDGHLLRLWAEVFHVTSGGGGSIKWQQVSEDLVPVNITCNQTSPSDTQRIYSITAYNSQVDKVLDVTLVQPGTRIGQASECFVYWKDPVTSDTWGLNFTSPIDAKQFREVCSASFKLARKASSSYSLRDNNLRAVRGVNGVNSLSSSRGGSGRQIDPKRRPLSTPTSPSKSREPQCTCMTAEQYARLRAMDPRFRAASTLPHRTAMGPSGKDAGEYPSFRKGDSGNRSDGEMGRSGKGRMGGKGAREVLASRSVDYPQGQPVPGLKMDKKKSRSKSTEDVQAQPPEQSIQYSKIPDHHAHIEAVKRSKMQTRTTTGTNTTPTDDERENYSLKRRLKNLTTGSVSTSPEVSRKIYCHDGYISEPESRHAKLHIIHDTRQGREKRRGVGTQTAHFATSPPSDHRIFDHAYYATTPSSSPEDNARASPSREDQSGSPTARLLLEYEQHLRNTLAKGLDAESYSLHTFEAIISKSNENLATMPPTQTGRMSTTLPRNLHQQQQLSLQGMPMGPGRYGGYDTARDRGYLSDHNSRTNGFFDQMQRSGYCSDREARSGYFSENENAQHKYGPIRQQSFESADSRLCYLTSSEISDDERMSLTTAVSDEDGAGDGTTSPRGRKSSSFNCTGAVRKAGFLSVKKWLLRKRHQIELAKRRGWKGYWVCLKGTTLLFYPCDARETRSVEAAPKHLIIVDGAVMQPIPEHPKRDYIFCLSTAFGDAYLFQAPCQVELESWVHSIHWSCAAAFARHRGKTGTLHLLQEEIVRLDKSIESDGKLRHMAELQRSVVADPETRQQLASQISSWEENIERLHCEQFRLRCYMTSLQVGELPNPKSLLSHVSRTTKNILNRLGVFTVSSFHAYVCARSPSLLSNLLAGRGATKRRAPLLSRSNSGSRRSMHATDSGGKESEKVGKVQFDNQVMSVPLREDMTVEEFLVVACAKKGLSPMEQFLRVKKRRELPDTNYFVPHRNDLVESYLTTHEVVEVRGKLLYQVEISRGALDQMWGFSVEAELVENSDKQDELCCYVSRVEDKSVAMNNGIIKGDEILVINGAIVSDLDMMFIESVLQEELSLCLMLRSSRTEQPHLSMALAASDAAIAQLVCPPPPSDQVLTDDALSHLIVPAPHKQGKEISPTDTEENYKSGGEHSGRNSGRNSRADSQEIEALIKSAGEITGFCRVGEGGVPTELYEPSPLIESSPIHAHMGLPDAEKMKKIIQELLETERMYVKHMTVLLEQYLEPLKYENFLSTTELAAIFGNTREIVEIQQQFLESLEHGIRLEDPSFDSLAHTYEFKEILQNIALTFLNFADNFKLYSSFCASHSKAQKLLHPTEGNQALQQFIVARNPRMQHSNTLESYLIKPIQRILKYPLLLQQLRNLCDINTEEYRSLAEALQCMERCAEFINEMQRINEEYGAIFEHLFRQHQKQAKSEIELSPGDLQHYGGVEWLNIADFLGKIKKGLELHAMCFVFKSAVVFLCKERLRHKRKLMGSTSRGVADKSEVEIIRYQVLIPVSELQVRQIGAKNSDDESNQGPNFSWELVHMKCQAQRRTEKVYFLSNSTAEFRNAFLKNIRQIIRESVKNMSLPKGENPYATPEGLEKPSNAHRIQAQTLGRKKPPKPPQRHSAGNLEVGSAKIRSTSGGAGGGPESDRFRIRSKTMSDTNKGGGSGHPSVELTDEGAQEGGGGGHASTMPRIKGILGSTPNHLTLSTTSTLSAGSTGSAAKLIISSSAPGKQHSAPPLPEPTSPIWKPREGSFEGNLPSSSKKDEDASKEPSTSAAGNNSTKSETHTKKK